MRTQQSQLASANLEKLKMEEVFSLFILKFFLLEFTITFFIKFLQSPGSAFWNTIIFLSLQNMFRSIIDLLTSKSCNKLWSITIYLLIILKGLVTRCEYFVYKYIHALATQWTRNLNNVWAKQVHYNQFDSYIQWFEFIETAAIFKPWVKSRNKG